MSIRISDLTRYGFNSDGTPIFLYHYTSIESAIKILTTGNLLMNSLSNMNDPWEFLWRTPCVISNGDPSIQESLEMVQNNQLAHEERNKCVRLVSFAMDKNNSCSKLHKGWNLLSMWALYGNNHAGACLIFDFKSLCHSFNDMCENKTIAHEYRPIDYVDDLDDLEDMFHQPITSFVDSVHRKHLFTKPDNYAPEQEYRFIIINPNLSDTNSREKMPIKAAIRGIITGYRYNQVKQQYESQLANALASYGDEISRFEMNSAMLTDPLYSQKETSEWIDKIQKKYGIE